MKEYEISIRKTIRNFDVIVTSEELALQAATFHEDQWLMQEESWTFAKADRCRALWNKLVELIKQKYPTIVGIEEE